MKKYLLIAIIVLLGIVACLSTSLKKETEERSRQERNVEILNDDIERYKFQDSLNAISVGRLNYTVAELKKYRAQDAKLIKDLNLRLKDVKEIIKTEIITRDSLVYILDTLGCFHHRSKWLKVDACTRDSSMVIESRDSIAQIIHTEYKHRFLWWRWGVKGFYQEIINFNPHSNIEYNEFIQVK